MPPAPIEPTNLQLRNGMPLFARQASVSPSTWNPETRTVDVSLGTGIDVLRYDWRAGVYYWERLSMDPMHIRTARMDAGMPFFEDHNSYTVRATVGRFTAGQTRIDTGAIVGTVRLSKAKRHEDTTGDIADGILIDPSIGYVVHAFDDPAKRQKVDGIEVRTAIDWEPWEGSIVGLKADITAGVRSAADTHQEDHNMSLDVNKDKGADTGAADEKTRKAALDAREAELKAREEQLAKEKRETDIRSIGTLARMPSKDVDALVADATVTVESARAKAFEFKCAEDQRHVTHSTHSGIAGEDETDKVRSAIADCLAHRSNSILFPKMAAPGAEDFRGMKMPEILRFLGERNGAPGLRRMSELDLCEHFFGDGADSHRSAIQMTASDFASITSQVVGLAFVHLYNAEKPLYQLFCSARTAPNLEEQTEVDFGAEDVLDQLGDDAEIKLGKFKDGKLKWRVFSFAKRYPFGRRLILASRIDLLTEIPRQLVDKIRTLENNLAFLPITRNDIAADGTRLFDASRGNIGIAGIPSVTTLDEMFKVMGLQENISGQPMNLEPKTLLVPHGKRALASKVVGEQMLANKPENVVPGYMKGITVIPEGRLDRADATAFYGAADPNRFASIVYATLEGATAPRISTRIGWEVQGVEWKVEHDFGVTPMSGKGLFKNPGA